MSSEAIALEIQAGENHYEELWNRVKGFIYKQAFSYCRYFPDSIIEADDLAQAGYLALCDAVKSFEPDRGSFLSLLRYKLINAWRTMYGLRGKTDPLNDAAADDDFRKAFSLDMPISDDDERSWLDSVQDPAAEDAFTGKDEQIFQSELRACLEKALDAAPHGDVIRRRYFNGETGKQIAESMGVSPQRVQQYEQDAKRYLRRGPYTRELRSFDFYHGTGFQSWKDTGMSIEERYVLQRH